MRSKTKQQGFRGHASTLLESIRDDCRRNEQPDIYETSYKPLLLEKSHNYRRKKIESQGLQTPPKSKSSMNNFNLSIYSDCSYRSAFTPKPRSAKSFRYVFNVNSNARKASRATHTDVDATRQLSSSISGTTPDKKTAFLMRLYIAKTKDLQITPNHKQQRIFLARLQAGIDQKQFVAPECDFGYNATQLIIKYLAKNAVEKLILDKNPLGDESMKKLAEIIPSLKLKQLSLVSINITSKSGSILLKSLIGNENLRTLNLSSPEGLNRNRINPEGFIQIASLLRHPLCCLHTLNLSNTGMGEAGFLSFLLGFQQTSHLRFKSINLAYNQISIDESQQAFATSCIGNISVERLQLQGNNLSDLGGKVLAYIIGGKYGRSVISMSIQYLDVSDNKIKLFGFQSLCNLLPINKKLTQFNANNNNLAEKDIFYAVKNLLIHTWSIKILSLKNTLPASPQSIAHHIKSLAQGLFNNKSLKQLDISESNLPENGFFMIFEALQANKTLKILKLEGCGISDSFIIKAEPIMKNCKALMQINLCNNFITDIGAKILIRILASNHDLMQMNLKKNCISLHILNDVNYQIKQNKQMIRPEDPQFMYLQYVNGLQEEQKKNIQTSISQMNSKKKYINARDLALEIVKDQEQISKKEQEIKVEKTKISKIESEIHCETLQRVKRRKKQNHNDEPQGQSVEHDTFLVTN